MLYIYIKAKLISSCLWLAEVGVGERSQVLPGFSMPVLTSLESAFVGDHVFCPGVKSALTHFTVNLA